MTPITPTNLSNHKTPPKGIITKEFIETIYFLDLLVAPAFSGSYWGEKVVLEMCVIVCYDNICLNYFNGEDMRKLVVLFGCFIIRKLLSLRYKLTVIGKDEILKQLKGEGKIIFLPNHPAHVDPILIGSYIWPYFHTRPLVVEYIYRQSIINFAMRMMRAIPIPNFETSLNEIKRKNAEETIEKIIDGLKHDDNFMLYPGGRLKHTGKEILGGTSAAYTIVQKLPDVKVVLIRTTGLWGSSFSRAATGKSPDFKSTFLKNVKVALKNFIFFIPKRHVTIEFKYAQDLPRDKSKLEFNRFLEDWYNRYPVNGGYTDVEPLILVSYAFWKEDLLKIKVREQKKEKKNKKKIQEATKEVIFKEIARMRSKNITEIKEEMSLTNDLAMDSLDLADIVSFLSIHFDVGAVHPNDLETVKDVLEIADGIKEHFIEKEDVNYTWPQEKNRELYLRPQGKTVQEAFLTMSDNMKHSFACGDDLSGPLSYRKLKMAALILSKEIEKIPTKNIGILFPASVGVYIVLLATMLAKKVPVMLNWTLGPRYLQDMCDKTGVDKVITSWRFIERLSNVDLGNLTDKLLYIEDIKAKISTKGKIMGVMEMMMPAKTILKKRGLDQIKEDDVAAILFTSGTEASPKAVPLTHKNMLSNQSASLNTVEFFKDDIMLGTLPPFHSFGFNVVGLLPILSGIRIVYSPDPTDSFTLAEIIERWHVTVICLAPSFLRSLLQAATVEQLKSVRLYVVGAEKAPKELFEKVTSLGTNAHLLEGYGITECSPVISIHREKEDPIGVGRVLEGVKLCTIDLNTQKVLPRGQEGEICVNGPNVFQGYINHPKSPFIEIDNKLWYRTGDLGYIDEKDNVILSGRLKRFAKMAGEMISLGGVEEVILEGLKKKKIVPKDEAILAVDVKEEESGKPYLILFTTLDLDKDEINMMLKDAGLSRLIKIAVVKKVEEIPLMGTGKVNYRLLQTWV
jgi:long-chain-fatty-acid--[acyl-carrier-protein] ligase